MGLLAAVDVEARLWKAGALRARRAADWVRSSVLVRVVVVLGTELVLVVRSEGGGAWAVVLVVAGTDDTACAPLVVAVADEAFVGPVPFRQSVEVDSATDWRVVVAGVNAGGSVAASPWGSGMGWLRLTAGAAVLEGQLGGLGFASAPGIVGIALLELQRNVHGPMRRE